MGDHNASPSSSAAVERRGRRGSGEEGGGACTGRSCQSCTAGVIADCVAVCCCPCAVVNILTLAFVKLPWAVARRCLRRRKRRRMLEEERRCCCGGTDGISRNGRVDLGTSEMAASSDDVNDHFSAELNDHFGPGFKPEDVWLEVAHLGFGRVSFTEIPFQEKGD